VNDRRLVIVMGAEGAGKSTTVRALLPLTPSGARIDAEDLGDLNPLRMDDAFFALLRQNVAALVQGFWAGGYSNVVAGSFLRSHDDYQDFRSLLTGDFSVHVVNLCAEKPVRDQRRIARSKPSTKEWRDSIDATHGEDTSFETADADYTYLRIENSGLSVQETIEHVRQGIPEIYQSSA
jgi:ribose 1,5-bisphosphokinase PhnN